MVVQYLFYLVTPRTWPLASLGALITTVGGVMPYMGLVVNKLIWDFEFIGGKEFLYIFKLLSVSLMLELISFVMSFMGKVQLNSFGDNAFILFGMSLFILTLYSGNFLFKEVKVWSRTLILWKFRALLGFLLFGYMLWVSLILFAHNLFLSGFLIKFILVSSFFSTFVLIRRLENLNIKRFLMWLTIIKLFIYFSFLLLHFVLPFEYISPFLSEHKELYVFYIENIVNIDEWSPVKIFLFIMPLSHLAFSVEGYYLAMGFGVYNTKIFSLAVDLDSLVQYTSTTHSLFQKQMRCLESILPDPKLPLNTRLLFVENLSEGYFQDKVKEYNNILSKTGRSNWALNLSENYSKDFSKFKKVPLFLNGIDLEMKRALIGNGISGFNLLKNFDQGSPYLNKVTFNQWAGYQRGVAYAKVLLNEESIMKWRLAFDDPSYRASSEADTNSDRCFQLVREAETVIHYLRLYECIDVERPLSKCEGDFLITDTAGVKKSCEIKSLTVSKEAPKLLPCNEKEKGYDYLKKQLELRFIDMDIYFEKHGISKGIALVQLNCLSTDTDLINFKAESKISGLNKNHIHAIVGYNPEKK